MLNFPIFGQPTNPHTMSKITLANTLNIAMADDDEDDRELFEAAVADVLANYTLALYNNGKQLLDALADKTKAVPDIVFLDLNMPLLSGLETLQEIRKIEQFKYIPIIAIYSTSSAVTDKKNTLAHGANAYLCKPQSFTELKALIRKAIEIDWNERVTDFENFSITLV